MAPAVSIVIPVRNGERFVAEAVAGVLAQLSPHDELLVVDDGSTDATPGILTALSDPRIVRLQADGQGVSAARNLGIARARGELIGFLDHDDLWPEGRQAVLLAALAAHPQCGAAFGRVRMRFEADALPNDPGGAMDGLHVPELVGSGLYRIGPVRAAGGFAEDMRLREDADFHFRLVEAGLVPALVETETLVYRRHGSNVTADDAAIRFALIDLARRKLARQKAKNGP